MPPGIDQVAANKRYRDASSLVSSLSGLIPGASHAVEEPEAQEWLSKKVIEFLKALEK